MATTTCVPLAAYAACLPSDASVECIGVYKERSTDVTKEDAKAAGIRWVDQPSFTSCAKAATYLRDARPQIASARHAAATRSVARSGDAATEQDQRESRRGDLLQRGPVVPVFGEHGLGRVQDGAAAHQALAFTAGERGDGFQCGRLVKR